MEELFLYQKLDVLKQTNRLSEIPEYVKHCLSKDKTLRKYQAEAFRYFITYFEDEKLNLKRQIHTLFYMATGSGKTLIMAILIYYLYTKGYSNFLFFVNQTNILEKTRDNFLNSLSSKYLFNQHLEYAGKKIKINSVDNFQYTQDEDINICFTTTQHLHNDLFIPKENSLTFDDFKNKAVVFICDESHHINANTKKVSSKAYIEEENNWEYSVMSSFKSHKDSILLEFTATIDLEDVNVFQKYKDKIIYNYPLKEFREDGFTKVFENFATEASPWQRTLMAMVLSEYRRFLASDVKLNIKPVLLLKSKTVKESINFYKEFFERLTLLSSEEITCLYESDIAIFLRALSYFKEKDDSFILLKQALQSSFQKEKAIIINGNSDNSKEKQLLLNSLEDEDNQIRVIFAVDMLNEGWDVLNLFDIVRLYDSKQSNYKVDNYTIKEAQLIGRAARYFPFQLEDFQEKNKRKYDCDIENKFRMLETMYFHSNKDSGYIVSLKKALIKTGFESEKPIKLTLSLKEEFKQSKFYNTAFVFSNKRKKKERKSIYEIENIIKNKIYTYVVPSLKGKLEDIFGNIIYEKTETKLKTIKLKDIDYNILLGAIDFFAPLSFNMLKKTYPNLHSIKEFLTCSSYLGDITIEFEYKDKIRGKDIFEAVKKVFSEISNHVISIKTEYEGSTEFEMNYLKNILKDKTIYLTDTSDNGGKGCSQNNCLNQEYKLNLAKENWYVFNDNYGTQEEKLFIKFFKTDIAPILDEKHIEYYVIRNERIPELAIYNFEDGKRFEADYLLFIKQKNMPTYQVYAEPKAEMLFAEDAWKENFMLNIKCKHNISSSIASNYKILGLPFFNHIYKLDEFKKAFDKFIDECID